MFLGLKIKTTFSSNNNSSTFIPFDIRNSANQILLIKGNLNESIPGPIDSISELTYFTKDKEV